MLRFLPFVLKNSWRNRRRTTLTIVSISVSLCLLGVLMAIYYAFYFTDATPSQALRLVVRNKISIASFLPARQRSVIERIPGVEAVSPFSWFGGKFKDEQNMSFAQFAMEQILRVAIAAAGFSPSAARW